MHLSVLDSDIFAGIQVTLVESPCYFIYLFSVICYTNSHAASFTSTGLAVNVLKPNQTTSLKRLFKKGRHHN